MILVTGATGHVGRAVVSRLASLGHDVVAMIRDVQEGAALDEPNGPAEGGAELRLAAQTNDDADRVDRVARTRARLRRAVRLDRTDAKLYLALLCRQPRQGKTLPGPAAARLQRRLGEAVAAIDAHLSGSDATKRPRPTPDFDRLTRRDHRIGRGATMTASGAIAQTGRCAARPAATSSAAAGSL